MAGYCADYLKQIGSLFDIRESYSDWYYGLGGTYPDVNGALEIHFEQASPRSLKQETNKGVMTYAFGLFLNAVHFGQILTSED
jgi:hypothetical protein